MTTETLVTEEQLRAVPSSHRLWGGRFEGGPAASLEDLNRSLPVDQRLWREDIEGSRAWVQALTRAGVLTREEARRLDEGLLAVADRLSKGIPADAQDEDIHTLVERMLYEEIGDVAGKLHTGRSRNDQVATDTRLWAMRALRQVDVELRALQSAILEQAARNVDLVMPSYTHLRRAQPVRVAHWLLGHFWALDRDRHRLASDIERVATLPLGCGAIAGSGFPVDRTLLKELLGFRSVTQNSIDTVGDRDWICETVFVAALLGAHLSRIAEDLIIYSSEEFGFVRLPEAYTTGSSLMPQKRNPDGLELARGKAARLAGDVAGALAMLKGLPSGYNKDMQEDKALLFSAVDALLLLLPPTRETIAGLQFNTGALSAALADETLLATDLAEELVRRGVPFREAHGLIGRVLREADQAGCAPSALPENVLRAIHVKLVEPTRVALTAEASVEARTAYGGTSRSAVTAQILEARASIAS
ncbi:MAG: argininosuccinate lyase [Gemmatimonadota bacterium]